MKVPLPWQTEAWQRLQAQRRDGRLPHALLFHGPAGSGKGALARGLAHSLLCREPSPQGEPCGRCRDCTLLAAGTHPDLTLVVPEEGSRQIRIDAIRALVEADTLAVEPGRARIFIVEPAERMGTAAANALLKTLEEPVPGTHMLLVSHNPDQLPITIRSRCQPVRLPLPAAAAAQAWLAEQGVSDADRRLAVTGGAPLAALALDEEAVAAWEARQKDLADLTAGRADPLAVAERWEKAADLETLLGELGARATARLREQAATGLAPRLFTYLDRVFETRRELTHNPNPRLVLEDLLIEWQQITTGGR